MGKDMVLARATALPTTQRVPFNDLRAAHEVMRDDLEAAFRACLDDSSFSGGPKVALFEDAFAAYAGTPHAIALASGTDALELVLRALGVGVGDLVITVPNTFMATVEAIIQVGAQPHFVDVEPDTLNLDPAALRIYLTQHCDMDSDGRLFDVALQRRIAAIIPVHLYGCPANMAPILELAASAGVPVIEDACQAHGAKYQSPDGTWVSAGTLGVAGAFSFYPGKNLGALGEAGAAITADDDLAQALRLLRSHGERERYIHVRADGVNARMDALQAAVLSAKLPRLDAWNARRREVVSWYEEFLHPSVRLPREPEYAQSSWHIYAVRVPERDRVRARLSDCGVETGLHYPLPLHLQEALAYLGLGPGSFPVAEAAAAELISLPMHPYMTREQVEYVAAQLLEAIL